jgi:CheY-like chemotaxis protein
MANAGEISDDIITSWPAEGPVVIVDDDSSDALMTEGIVDELQPKFPVQILSGGEDLLAYLQGQGLYHDRANYPLPGVILLDIKMPKMDGFAVLEWLKEHPEFENIPVVVLSGCTDMAGSVTRAYQLGAQSFLPKPIQLQDMQSIVTLLKIGI